MCSNGACWTKSQASRTALVVMSKRSADFLQRSIRFHRTRSISFPTAFPICRLSIRASTRICSALKARSCFSASACSRRTRASRTVISALPAILAKHPNVVYIILGATHPHVLRHDGESYRLSLQWLAREKGVEGNVIFYNRFVSLEELIEFIGAADIYITPYLEPGADRLGHAGLHAGRRQGRHLDALLVRRRDAGRRARRAGAVSRSGGARQNRSSICWTTRPSVMPCASGPICSAGR